LKLHLDPEKDKDLIESITENLTTKFHSHLHFINRKEASEILSEKIIDHPNEKIEKMLMELYDLYAKSLNIRHGFCFDSELGDQAEKTVKLCGGIIENDTISYRYETDVLIRQRSEIPLNINVPLQPGQNTLPIIKGLPIAYQWEVKSEGWLKNSEGV